MPKSERMVLPAGYGTTKRTRPWSDVREQLTVAKQYWLATDRRGRSPHLVPVDGLWVDDVLYYGGSPDTLHMRAAKANPNVTVHLPDPWKVVIVEGVAEPEQTSPELAQQLADLANVKYAEYGMTFDASAYREPLALRPRRVLTWSAFPADATRFRFE